MFRFVRSQFRGTLLPLLAVAVVGTVGMYLSVTVHPFVGLAFGLACAASVGIIRSPLVGVILIAITLPLERIGAYEVGGLTVRVSQLILVVTAVVSGIRILAGRGIRVPRSPFGVVSMMFIAALVLSLGNVVNMGRSLMVLFFTLFTMSVAWVVSSTIHDRRTLNYVVAALIVSGLVVSIFGLFQFAGDMIGLPTSITGLRDLYTKGVLGFSRVQSTAYEPLYFANYLLLPLFLALSLIMGRSRVVPLWVLLLFLVAGGSSFILTVSRGAYLGMVGALMVCGVFYFRRMFTLRNIFSVVVAVLVIWWIVVKTLGIGGELLVFDKFQEHILGVFFGASYDERVDTIDQAFTVWHEHPLIGIGVGAFGPTVAPHPFVVPKDGWKIVNNEYIELLAETGLIGLTLFMLLISLLVARSVHAIRVTNDPTVRAVMIGLLAAFVGMLIQYLTFSTLYIMHIWFLVGFMIAVQHMALRSVEQTNDASLHV